MMMMTMTGTREGERSKYEVKGHEKKRWTSEGGETGEEGQQYSASDGMREQREGRRRGREGKRKYCPHGHFQKSAPMAKTLG